MADDSQISDFLLSGRPPRGQSAQDHLDIDKAWHGIHYLLTGNEDEDESDSDTDPDPIGEAILGGMEIGEDLGYGPARYLHADEVVAVAGALQATSREELAERFAPAQMDEVYPQIWDEGDEALEYLLSSYDAVVEFYRQAAQSGKAVILYLS